MDTADEHTGEDVLSEPTEVTEKEIVALLRNHDIYSAIANLIARHLMHSYEIRRRQ